MYNVVIVDDEPVIRFGLKASVEWEKEGLSLVGDFPNGETAFHVMEETHVDILITDIKMPIMDGLTLMKKALDINPKLKVILVSSYNEFEYVKEGLKYGAVDYVLKPTLEQEEFVQLIQKCVHKLNEEKNIENKLKFVDQTNSLMERKKAEQELKRALLDEKGFSSDCKIMSLLSGEVLVVYMKLNNVAKIDDEYGALFKKFTIEEIQERFYSNFTKGVCISIGDTELVFFFHSDIHPITVIDQIKDEAIIGSALQFSFGFDTISNISEAKQGLKRSMSACERQFFHPSEMVYYYKEPKKKTTNHTKVEEVKHFILPVDEEKVTKYLEQLYLQWKKEELHPSEIKQEASEFLSNLFLNKLDLTLLLDKCEELGQAESLDELIIMMKKHMQECMKLVSEQKSKPRSDNELMERAINYIHQHYTNELTLQMVADHIHISRNYFSVLFKQFSDQKFIDYVIDLRVKKAKELLVQTSLKVYEVAGRSGFNDVKYFSKLFKKLTGYSPVDYRTFHQK
ncbi:response regulator transcription factor [Halalkalibacter alkalisediminis]|uniref:Response regulator n=1 Tax=Halalkalibacter alkalisediminis TaxID=935616 RepID=A0ABV6NLB2_9BACI|nr:response regulator [Halalkalibacter alkalisediminis]